MIGWFAAHKVVVLLGAALVVGAVFLLRRGGGRGDGSYGGIPVNPYATNSPPPAGGLTMFPNLPSPAPLQDPEPGGPAPGPQPGAGVADSGGAGAQVSTGPGAGPSVAIPLFFEDVVEAIAPQDPQAPTFVASADAPAFGMIGDQPAFQPVEPSYNPVYGGQVTVSSLPSYSMVGTSGTVSDITYAPGGAPQGGVPALVDPSGHVVNAKGARVGGVTGD